jgi:hypothetical protein
MEVMGLFGKDEVVDYTLLAKKGLLKLPEKKKIELKTEGGFVDFTSMHSASENAAAEMPAEVSAAGSAGSAMPDLGFLGSLAGAGSSAESSSSAALSASSPDMSTLRVKIDDMEYKLDRFIERLDKIEEKISKAGESI